MQYLTLEHTMR